jgi:hypothetical protein
MAIGSLQMHQIAPTLVPYKERESSLFFRLCFVTRVGRFRLVYSFLDDGAAVGYISVPHSVLDVKHQYLKLYMLY